MTYDVVVIGGGQAGLSVGYYLKQQGKSFLILDEKGDVGDSWKKRYDSLVLFTPRNGFLDQKKKPIFTRVVTNEDLIETICLK
ncbi:FAD-dependent oxidoreductase [Shouchella patagoniensis]|uniref:FAD-dependent oxidoreductase n=1 Tax=Shouchella patagoniensis TaxID=228576 RepID=UPI003F5A9D6A